jgi:hypothetical protein
MPASIAGREELRAVHYGGVRNAPATPCDGRGRLATNAAYAGLDAKTWWSIRVKAPLHAYVQTNDAASQRYRPYPGLEAVSTDFTPIFTAPVALSGSQPLVAE